MVRSSSREQWRARKRTLRELRQASFLVSYRTLAFIDANAAHCPHSEPLALSNRHLPPLIPSWLLRARQQLALG